MIAAVDVHYHGDDSALAAAVVFEKYTDPAPMASYTCIIEHVEAYLPGSFYLRELPGILSILKTIQEKLDTVIIDGYVSLGDRPGLGAYLRLATGEQFSVIGVAKTRYLGSQAEAVFRGRSLRPLYVTAAGLNQKAAAGLVAKMHGESRIPSLIKLVDHLSKEAI